MNRFLALMIAATASALLAGGAHAQAQNVGMIGDWYSFNGAVVNIPYNPPVIPCTPGIGGACPKKISLTGTTFNQPSFGIPAAGTIMGGVNVGDSFEIKPEMFKQNLGSQFGAIPYNFAVHQINTRFSYKAPSSSRIVSPPANTRQFAQNAWSLPGNGQTGRLNADTTVVSAAGKTTVTYKAGTNAFGGTMHMLLRGPGELYLNGALFGSATAPTSLPQPWLGIQPIGSSVSPSPFRTRPAGIGWGLTAMGTQFAGVVRAGAALAPPCTVLVPPGPAGCELVLNTGLFDIFPLFTATSVIHGFPFTTGTVKVGFVGTVAGGPGTFTLSGNGYDTTTPNGIRNIAMVAGSYQVRTDDTGVGYTPTMGIVELSFVPEPSAGIALAGGGVVLGLLHLLNRRRQKRS